MRWQLKTSTLHWWSIISFPWSINTRPQPVLNFFWKELEEFLKNWNCSGPGGGDGCFEFFLKKSQFWKTERKTQCSGPGGGDGSPPGLPPAPEHNQVGLAIKVENDIVLCVEKSFPLTKKVICSSLAYKWEIVPWGLKNYSVHRRRTLWRFE